MRRTSPEAAAPSEVAIRRPWPEAWTAAGIIEVLEPLVVDARRARLREVLDRRLSSVTVLLDDVQDPHNGAAIVRSCDAFGIQEAHIVCGTVPFLASNVVSKGTERWVDIFEYPDAKSAAERLRQRGFELVTTHPQGRMTPDQLATLPKVALVLGNELDGVSDPLVRAAGRSVRVPMVGFVESLNVSVSAAILLHAATRGRCGDLSAREQQRLYARGLFHTVKRSADVLAASSPR